MLGIEHHLLVRPLGQLGIGLVDVGRGGRQLARERLARLLRQLGVVERRVERGGVYRRGPAALLLLLGWESVRRLGQGVLLLGQQELLLLDVLGRVGG